MVKEYTHTKRARRGGHGAQFGYNNGQKKNTPEKERAARGQFDFDVINGFKLKEVEFKTPPKGEREAMREQFKKEVRPAFLKYVAEHFVDELHAMGISDAGIANMRKGIGVNGYNVHHKLPIHGGGTNDFKNLIIMPIRPHDELHHEVIDPQLKNQNLSAGIKIKLPWCDDMVWKRPAKSREKLNVSVAQLMQKQAGR
ncbi:MAG: HNH endonuclease [Alphaproteobacteria bacterium]|nr:HNH endonuclease [Alphaproteobacteria bacterium]